MYFQQFKWKEFESSTIHAKIKIDTTKMSPEQVLNEFLEQARQRHLTTADLTRIILNKS